MPTYNRLATPIAERITEAEKDALFQLRLRLSRAKRQESKGNPHERNEARQRTTGHAQQG